MKSKMKKHKYVSITQSAYDVLTKMKEKDLRPDGTEKTRCEIVSTLIVRAAAQ